MTFNLADFFKWFLSVLVAFGILTGIVGCSNKDKVANFEATLEALQKHHVAYRGKVTGPTAGRFQLYSGGDFGSGGWLDIEISNSSLVPTNDSTSDTVVGTSN